MIELEAPHIEPVEELGAYAKYEAGPLEAGYGVTIGNALRRVLLSSLEGAAVTSIQVRDVYQEFSTIPGVKEEDRKSTRLNSSHSQISYAVFCLKKKKKKERQ